MGSGITPTLKTAALNTRYIGWWYVPGHRQHTALIEIYEK